jgi:hypothetical protein
MLMQMPSQREQYRSTVHLFIGTRCSPCKITLMPFTFINNSIVILRGLIWLFIFKLVPFFWCHAEAFLHIASWSSHPSSWSPSIPVKLRLDHALVYPQPDSEDACSHTWKTLSNHVFEDLRKPKAPNTLLCDNESVIRMADNPVEHSRTKHIDIRHHFFRDHQQKGDIEVFYVSTKNQLADIFTKPLDESTFCRLRSELNVLDSRNLDWSIAYMCFMPLIMFHYAYCCLFMVLKLYTWSPDLTSPFASDAPI